MLEYDGFQPRPAVGKGGRLVIVEKEGGVTEPGPDDLFIARNDGLRAAALEVGDGDEQGQQLSLFIQQMKVLLMLFHGRDQGAGGHFQERGIKTAPQRHRPLDQPCHLIQQVVSNHRLGVCLCGTRHHLGPDLLPARGKVRQHEGIM